MQQGCPISAKVGKRTAFKHPLEYQIDQDNYPIPELVLGWRSAYETASISL